MPSFKIYFSTDNIRRFSTDQMITFEAFVTLMSKQYSQHFHPELRIQYVDSEGDKIDVNSQIEWDEMMAEMKSTNQNIIKIHIVEGKSGKYFKDGPPAQPLFFYSDTIEKKSVVPDNAEELKSRIPRCLEELFPGRKILPHHMPSYLAPCVSITDLCNGEVDLDVDVSKLLAILHQTGMDALDVKDYAKGRLMFNSLCILQPTNYIAHYNLACALSLLGDIENSLAILKKAIELGYANVNHMRQDSDLDNIKKTEEFFYLCQKLEFQQIPELKQSTPIKDAATVVTEPVLETPTEPVPEPKEPVPVPQEPVPVPQEPVPVPQEPVPVPHEPIPFSFSDSMLTDPLLLSQGREKWQNQLSVLHELGFLSDSVLIPILDANKGNVETTLAELLNF